MIDTAPLFSDPSVLRAFDAAPRSLVEVSASIDYKEALPLGDHRYVRTSEARAERFKRRFYATFGYQHESSEFKPPTDGRHVHRFLPDDAGAGLAAPPASAPRTQGGDIDNRSEVQRRSRMAELRRALAGSDTRTPARLRAALIGELAGLHESLDELDEALRLREKEELPLHDALGAARARAATMGRIADVLHARGQLDEGLRIRRENVLPVYERLGGTRSRAATMAGSPTSTSRGANSTRPSACAAPTSCRSTSGCTTCGRKPRSRCGSATC